MTAEEKIRHYAERCNLMDQDVEYMTEVVHEAVAEMQERCAKAAEQGHEAGGSTAGIAAFIRALK